MHRVGRQAATRSLAYRRSGDNSLIKVQLFVGDRAGSRGTEWPTVAHDLISDLDWNITMLYGAAGYIIDEPTRALNVSALVANAGGVKW